MEVRLSKWQTQVWNDNHRFKVIDAGRRSGKSVFAQLWTIDRAANEKGLHWIVAPTYRQAKQIHWRGIQEFIPQALVEKKNEVELSITIKKGSEIQLKGAENPDALRGVKLRSLVIDEIASIRNWSWLWSEVLRPTLTDYAAPALFISTPKGFNHFHDLYQLGQNPSAQDYKSWRFTSYDNPYVPKGEIDNARKELTEDTFHQEYMADFRKYTGLVYKDFDRETNVIDPFDIPDSYTLYRGIDFGSTNPTACLWIAVDRDDNWFVVSEHYATGQTIDYHAGIINSNQYSSRVAATYGDPSGAQWISEFAERGVYITPANKEIGQAFNTWVTYGIDKVSQKLRRVPGRVVQHGSGSREHGDQGTPALYVFNTCQNLIREFELYRWKEKKEGHSDLNEPEQPEKANDHAMDALRYFAVSYVKQSPTDRQRYGEDYQFVNQTEDTKIWRIGK